MGVCTATQVKAITGISDSSQDTLLASLIAMVSQLFAREAGRLVGVTCCLEKASVVEYFSPVGGAVEHLWLTARPVVSITSIKEAAQHAYSGAAALAADTDYLLHAPSGRISRVGRWLAGVDAVQVTYVGGYTAAGATPGTGETALPADLEQAAALQVAFLWQRRDKLGLAGEGAAGGSYSNQAGIELLPLVRQVVRGYARMIG